MTISSVFGIAAIVPTLIFANPLPADASSYSVLYAFHTAPDKGALPQSVVSGGDGSIYSVTAAAGPYRSSQAGCNNVPRPSNACGTLFRISAEKSLTLLHSFYGTTGASGFQTKLVLKGSALFGTMQYGGAAQEGVVFLEHTDGSDFHLLHSFTRDASGFLPTGQLAVVGQKVIYGTTDESAQTGQGVLFKLLLDGTYSVLHTFNSSQFDIPESVAADGDGNVFVSDDQSTSSGDLCGSVFQYQPGSGNFVLIYKFQGGADGCVPYVAGFDRKGNVYGWTSEGSGPHPQGTLFELVLSNGAYQHEVLWTFSPTAGFAPAGLNVSPEGNLVGTAVAAFSSKPPDHSGYLFRYSSGTMTVLHDFIGSADGIYPDTTPAVTSSGQIIGSTFWGGDVSCSIFNSIGCGSIYQYTP